MDCLQINQEEMIERYLLGQLQESEQEALERHYFECPHCLKELETRRALREELARREVEIRAEATRAPGVRKWLWVPALAGATAAIALAVWLWPRPTSTVPTSPIAQTPATVPDNSPLVRLAHVEPPAYTPLTLRGSTNAANRRFHEAMAHYKEGDYAAVIPGLRQALRLDPTLPEANFYMGACYLLTSNEEEAIKSLNKTVSLGETPYLEDARFYLAKAYLRSHDIAAAQRELEKVVGLEGDRESEARQLLQQLATLSKTSP